MTLKPILTASAFFALAALCPAASVPLTSLVDDQTAVAISVGDVPALVKSWDASPLAKTWEDEQVAKFFAPARAEFKMDEWDDKVKEATGSTIRELLAFAQGEILFALPGDELAKLSGPDAPAAPGLIFAIDVGKNAAAIEKLIAEAQKKDTSPEPEVIETFAGVKVHISETKKASEDSKAETFVWAIVDGVWLLSPSKERVFTTIDALKKGGVESPLGRSERFVRSRQPSGESQTIFFVNFPAIYPAVRDAVAAKKNDAEGGGLPMGLDPEAVLGALGLDALGELFISSPTGEEHFLTHYGLTFTEKKGLLKFLAYEPGPVAKPEWVPAKWISVSSGKYSVKAFYAALEELAETISPPMAGWAQGQIKDFNKRLGIDIKRDFFGSFGSDIISAYALPPGSTSAKPPAWETMDQFFSVSLDNPAAFTKSVEALKALAGPAAETMFTKREYLKQTIYTINMPTPPGGAPAARGFSYAIANKSLLIGIGSPATVEAAIQGMAGGQPSYWARADVKAALADVPSEAAGVQVQDVAIMISSLFETAVALQAKAGEDGESKYVDPTAKPSVERIAALWGLVSGYMTSTPTGLSGTTRLASPKP